jgi:hypothetical protein
VIALQCSCSWMEQLPCISRRSSSGGGGGQHLKASSTLPQPQLAVFNACKVPGKPWVLVRFIGVSVVVCPRTSKAA